MRIAFRQPSETEPNRKLSTRKVSMTTAVLSFMQQNRPIHCKNKHLPCGSTIQNVELILDRRNTFL